MISRMKKVAEDDTNSQKKENAEKIVEEDDPTCPKVDYYLLRNEADLFPHSSLLDPIDSYKHTYIIIATEKIFEDAIDNEFLPVKLPNLRNFVNKIINVFRTSFSSDPPASFPPLKFQLRQNDKPLRFRMRNYFHSLRKLFSKTVSTVVHHGMAYLNPSSPWASATGLVPKPGSE